MLLEMQCVCGATYMASDAPGHRERCTRCSGFRNGYLLALKDWAWWKDGVEYVGSGVYTLKQAERMFTEEFDYK